MSSKAAAEKQQVAVSTTPLVQAPEERVPAQDEVQKAAQAQRNARKVIATIFTRTDWASIGTTSRRGSGTRHPLRAETPTAWSIWGVFTARAQARI